MCALQQAGAVDEKSYCGLGLRPGPRLYPTPLPLTLMTSQRDFT